MAGEESKEIEGITGNDMAGEAGKEIEGNYR